MTSGPNETARMRHSSTPPILCHGWTFTVWAAALVLCSPWPADAGSPAADQGAALPKLQVTNSAAVDAATVAMPIVAIVNGEEITRQLLGQECLRHYGREILDGMLNRRLIAQECERQNIKVTRSEVDQEIDRMASKFGLPVEQWYKMLKSERGIKPAQYAADIVWPMLALRKLAGGQLQVSREELQSAWETQCGPAVCVRAIVLDDPRDAQNVRAAAVAHPEDFGNLAKRFSKDLNSAAAKGQIQPIRMHTGDPAIEQTAFHLQDNEISDVIPLEKQRNYVILKRDRLIPARGTSFELAKGPLEELIREHKLRSVAGSYFLQLQKNAHIENVFNDPVRRDQLPGVAALVNGQQITIQELAEQCIERHGEVVLEGTINRRLIEQACKKANLVVTDREMDEEIARAAESSLPPKKDGSPDVEGWLKAVTQKQGISVDLYRRDSVWPSVALRKMVANRVEVTNDDLQKGFEANYGPRVRCRAIVLGNARQAQRVWELARQNPTIAYFGELATQYSIEASSRALQGEVPPIKKNGGQPILEKEAFAMKPGELSSIIQAGDKFVILYCEGLTDPVKVDFASIRDLLFADIHEKKLRLAMAQRFEQLQDEASVDNLLAGTSRSPNRALGTRMPPGVPQPR